MRLVKGRSFYKEPWYGSYISMMGRCYRENAENYPNYGGRGISVCKEWHDIEVFEAWVAMSGYQKGLSLERKDVNGNYCPENCRWATQKEQTNNRRNTLFLELDGVRKSISEWSDILGVSASTLKSRYYRGWSDKDILTCYVIPGKERRHGKSIREEGELRCG